MAKKTFLLFVLVISLASASEAGIRLSLGAKFFDELRLYGLADLQTQLTNATVGPVDLDTSFWYVFHYGLKLTEPALNDVYFDIRQSNFTLNKYQQSIDIDISDVYLEYTANYEYTGTLIGSSTGNLTLTYSGANIKTRIVVDESLGKAGAYLGYVEPDLGDLSIDIDADGWLLYILSGIGHTFPFGYVTDGIMSALVRVVRWRMNSVVANLIDNMNFNYEIPSVGLSLDYHLLDLLVYEDQYGDEILYSAINATVFPTANPNAQSIYKSYLPETWAAPNDAVRIQFGEYVIDTMLWSLEYSNKLNFIFSNSTLPPDIAADLPLKVATLAIIVPGILDRFDQNQEIQFNCFPTIAPAFDINPVNIEAEITASCKLQIPVNATDIEDAFTINLKLHELFDLRISSNQTGTYLFPTLNVQNSTFVIPSVTDSTIGPVDISQLNQAFEYVFITFSRYANEYLFEAGIPLPIPSGISLTNPNFTTSPGWLEIGADVDLRNFAARLFD